MKRRSKKCDILLECGFTPEQIVVLDEHDMIDIAMESIHGPVPYEVKELLGMRGS